MRMYRTAIALLTSAALFGVLSSSAHADPRSGRAIFLNGVDLRGVTVPAAAFEHCTVTFDAKGNIHIKAPGFVFRKKPVGAPASSGQRASTLLPSQRMDSKNRVLHRRYMLVAREPRRGATGYQVIVQLNGRRVATIRSGAANRVVDITKSVRPGKNRLRFLATKQSAATSAGEPQHEPATLEIILAESDVSKIPQTTTRRASRRHSILSYKRSAAEAATFSHVYTFVAR